jgi:hypothetical protein
MRQQKNMPICRSFEHWQTTAALLPHNTSKQGIEDSNPSSSAPETIHLQGKYEGKGTSEALVYVAMSCSMGRRLARA